MKELERQALLADQAAVRSLLAEISENDPLGRLSFSSRLAVIERRLAELAENLVTVGSVALMFGGGPVHGSRSIDVGFASSILQTFKDLITKKVSNEELGKLGARGKIPLRSEVNLAVTDIVRGSVGFVLEEDTVNLEIADTLVKSAIDDITRVVISTASGSDDDFEREVDVLDHRLLLSLREFFKTLDDTQASLRIVEGQQDAQLDSKAVRRGRQRVDMIEIKDDESEQIVGELLGILPGSRRFEMKLYGTGEIIRGAVAATLAPTYLTSIEMPGETQLLGRVWRVKMKIREITERNKPPRRLYTLIGLIEPLESLAER
jgi:hypothetical protein